MAKRRGGFLGWLGRVFGGGPQEQPERAPSEPIMQPRPPARPRRTEPVPLPLSNTTYHVILAGYGPVWFRPYIGQDESDAKGYVINMQGYLRGGTRNHGIGYYDSNISDLGDASVSGVLDDGTEINEAEFETYTGAIEQYANIENLTGDGWKS